MFIVASGSDTIFQPEAAPPLHDTHVADAAGVLPGADSNPASEKGTFGRLLSADAGATGGTLELSDDAALPGETRAGSAAALFFTIKPLLQGSLFADAPAVPLERCAHRFEPWHQMQPFLWARQLPYFSYALLVFTVFAAVTLIFFDFCKSQWFHFLYTVPWIFFIGCEMTFGDRSAFDGYFAGLYISFPKCIHISFNSILDFSQS